MTVDVPVGTRKGSEWQTISLFRRVLEFSGGKVDCGQHHFGLNYTTRQNAFICASFLDVSCSRPFGRFDPKEMQGALSKSKVFVELSVLSIPDIFEWSLRMMVLVPVGFPENHLV